MADIEEKDLLEILKQRFPESIPFWKDYLEDEEQRQLTVSALTNFGYYAVDLINRERLKEVKKIFDYMEFLLCNGDQGVKDAVATGFLELLDNVAYDNEKIKRALVLLGEESKAYLKTWDDFWKGSSENKR